MLFIAHCDVEKSDSPDVDKYIGALFAESFAEAAQKLEDMFGSDLLNVTCLEPIGDNSGFVFLNEESEKSIREHPLNVW